MLLYFFKKNCFLTYSFYLLLFFPLTTWALEDCETAHDLLFQAYYLNDKGIGIAQQKRLFYRSLRLCPNQAKIQTALAHLFKQDQQYEQAIQYYQQALTINPHSYQAWDGLGQTYYQQNRFVLSVDAFSHICSLNKKIKANINQQFNQHYLNSTSKNGIKNADELSLIYHSNSRHTLNQRLTECGIGFQIKPRQVFFNITFNTTGISLSPDTAFQLNEIVDALQNSDIRLVIVHGHTDIRGFAKLSKAESADKNLNISKKRALAVVNKLIKMGIDKNSLKANGHGSKQALIKNATSFEDLEKNRRIEIEVQSLPKQGGKQLDEDDI